MFKACQTSDLVVLYVAPGCGQSF